LFRLILLLEIVIVFLEISLRPFELPVRQAEDDGKADQNYELKPGKLTLHFTLPYM
jgi:hypothetical protein